MVLIIAVVRCSLMPTVGSTVPTFSMEFPMPFPTWTNQVAPAAPCKQRLLKFRRLSGKAWNGPCGPRRLGRQPRLGRPAVPVKMKNGMDVGYIYTYYIYIYILYIYIYIYIHYPSTPVTCISGTGLVTCILGSQDWFQEPSLEPALSRIS